MTMPEIAIWYKTPFFNFPNLSWFKAKLSARERAPDQSAAYVPQSAYLSENPHNLRAMELIDRIGLI